MRSSSPGPGRDGPCSAHWRLDASQCRVTSDSLSPFVFTFLGLSQFRARSSAPGPPSGWASLRTLAVGAASIQGEVLQRWSVAFGPSHSTRFLVCPRSGRGPPALAPVGMGFIQGVGLWAYPNSGYGPPALAIFFGGGGSSPNPCPGLSRFRVRSSSPGPFLLPPHSNPFSWSFPIQGEVLQPWPQSGWVSCRVGMCFVQGAGLWARPNSG